VDWGRGVASLVGNYVGGGVGVGGAGVGAGGKRGRDAVPHGTYQVPVSWGIRMVMGDVGR